MRLRVRHTTRYEYSRPVSQAVNRLCLLPRSDARQRCLSSRVDIHPEPETVHRGTDHYGNEIARFGLYVPHTVCSVTVESVLDTRDELAPLPPSLDPAANLARLRERDGRLFERGEREAALMAHDCLLPSPYVPPDPVVDTLNAECPAEGRGVLEHAEALMHHIHRTFEYDPKFTSLVTPISAVLEARRGVCQDFAHLAIAALRRARIPARYVSGYLETLPPPGQEKLQGADASHAWFAVYDAEAGWFDFDPTNGKRPDRQYVVTAQGRDYGDVTPLKGIVYGAGRHRLRVEVDVDRLGADSGPTGLPPLDGASGGSRPPAGNASAERDRQPTLRAVPDGDPSSRLQ